MKIYNALDLKKGAKVKKNRLWSVSQPLQFLPLKEKDQEWCAWNLDWLEFNGLKQIRHNQRRIMKNYKLANGQIDKSDYIAESNNEMKDIVEELATSDELEALELKFYPIVPNIVNTLVAEFAKRDKRVTFRSVDPYSHNEILERKRAEIESYLVGKAEKKIQQRMMEMGVDLNSPEGQQQMQEQTSPENIRNLPEINEFYSKKYEVIAEKWATKQYNIDEQRFRMDELEERAFRDKLITDREFWHFNMYEDDYTLELWNPATTFYHKSPKIRYMSDANFIGNIEMMTAADIIDTYGWRMNEEQLESLQQIYPSKTPGMATGGYQNDGYYYDATKSHAWNTGSPSLAMRQYTAFNDAYVNNNNDAIRQILEQSEDSYFANENLFRVTTAYWKSQRKIGHLTKVHENGVVTTKIITEEYDITDKPIYNTSLIKNKTPRNLVFGEHVEWVWINQTYGGIKIGPNAPTFLGMENSSGVNPIYLGINQNQIKPLKFQFKGDNTQYGCKLPVEGRVFSDRNTKSASLVDSLKPFQIGYNIVNNQTADILIDEIGTVVMLDQNTLPKHSLGEDWGKGNLAKAYVAMKDFSMLPLDTSIANTENALNFNHFQQLDLSQTQRLMSRIQLSNYFKQEAYQLVGVSPQRMGQPLGNHVSATEAEQTQVGSYAQTEMHFIEHSEQLMPRVHEMRTNLAQWYGSTKPSLRIQYTTTLDEKVNLEINGTDILLADINVFITAKANARALLEQMKQLAVQNNTAGASIYDLGQIMKADSVGTLGVALKTAEAKTQQQMQEQRAHEQEMANKQLQQAEQEKAMELDHETKENEKDRRRDLMVAEIKASGFGAMQDINENNQSDFIDNMTKIKQTEQYQETIDIQRDKASSSIKNDNAKVALKQEELKLKRERMAADIEIAKENKNQYDVRAKKPDKKD